MEDILEFRTVEAPEALRVLIIEDNPEDEYFAKRTIHHILPEATIMSAEGIGEAYEVSRKSGFDLILLDLNLPDGFGPNSVQEVKRFFRHGTIFVLTGLASPLTTQQSLEKGASRLFMKKELSSPEFENAVRELYYSKASA